MLYLLNKYKEKFRADLMVCHVNHMIREDADEDETYVKEICEKWGIPFFSKKIHVEKLAKVQKKGTEEVGRNVRYEFFNEIAVKEGANVIAIAHNMNDCAETVLLNLIRGTGVSGLKGITPFRITKVDCNVYYEYSDAVIPDYKTVKIIRPLINCKKSDIIDFCKVNNIEMRIDSTNSENIYRRNLIRNEIIPELETINPNIVETLSRTASIIKEQEDFINLETDKQLASQMDVDEQGHISLEVKRFNRLHGVIKANIIRNIFQILTHKKCNLSKKNIDDIISLSENNVGNKYFEVGNIKVFVKNSKLYFI